MCPICWINGFLALLFGASAFSFGTEWYIVIPSFVLLGYGCYKIWQGIKRGKNFSEEQKANSKRSIINKFTNSRVLLNNQNILVSHSRCSRLLIHI